MTCFIEAVRRTTITTYDIEASLNFYRDTLGMQIWYDGVFDDPVVEEVYDLPKGTNTRVCILKGGDESQTVASDEIVTGMIGLMHFIDLPPPDIPPPTKRPLPGEIVVMMGTTRMREIELGLKQNGHPMFGPPIKLPTPGRNVVYELICRDPNGVRVNFAQQSEIGPSHIS